jgi:hypothetical protein
MSTPEYPSGDPRNRPRQDAGLDDDRIDDSRLDDARFDGARRFDGRSGLDDRRSGVDDRFDYDNGSDDRFPDDRRYDDRRYDTTDDDLVAQPVGARTTHDEVLAREQERFGGMKFGSAFFGWLTATGTAVLLTAIVAGVAAAIGIGALPTTEEIADAIADDATVGLVSAIIILLVLFIAYFAGGYVAGRMARFSGGKQGLAVWLWALILAIVLGVIGAVAGSQYDILANLNSFPRLPINEGALTAVGIVTAALALGVSLAGAVLGGVAGMRYHRRVDRVGLGR